MQSEWNLHLLRAVIEDGEPERHVNDLFTWFTVSFWADTALVEAKEPKRDAVLFDNYCYRVNAEVICISENPSYPFCILDFGIRAISESGSLLGIPLPAGCKRGDFVCGEVRLELPLSTDVHPYDLSCRWRVNRVVADLATFSIHPGDRGKVDYIDVSGTDAVKAGSYVLSCSTLNY